MKYIDLLDVNELLNKEIIGIDESGVGDYFTPLVSCAFYLPSHLKDWAKSLGVQDSKKLSDKKILTIAEKLRHNSEVSFSVYRLSQSAYNKLSDEFNAHELKFFTHNGALNNLHKKMSFIHKYLLIDKYTTLNSFEKYHKKMISKDTWYEFEDFDIIAFLATKAESLHLSVACASILARAELIKYMHEQSKEWNFDFPLGANKKVQEKVKEFCELHGEKNLSKVCKTSFKLSI